MAASGLIDTVGAFSAIDANAWSLATNPQYIKMLGVRNAINEIRGLYEAVVAPANAAAATATAAAAAGGAAVASAAEIQAVTDAFTAFQASQVKLVNLLTGVFPGGSRRRRQSKKKKNQKKHNNNQ